MSEFSWSGPGCSCSPATLTFYSAHHKVWFSIKETLIWVNLLQLLQSRIFNNEGKPLPQRILSHESCHV